MVCRRRKEYPMPETPRPKPKKPKWAIDRDRARRSGADQPSDTIWLFGLHAVRDALGNPRRVIRRLIVTPNAAAKLEEAIAASGLTPEIADPRKFRAPLDPQSVHQGAALETEPLNWGDLRKLCAPTREDPAPTIVLLDRVTDPHNVGAILRSAEVFGARAVIAPRHHSAPETGALAKAASGALERQPYLRVRNLGDAMQELALAGYFLIGLDGAAEMEIGPAVAATIGQPLGLILGSEGAGLRHRTQELCKTTARVGSARDFGSLNVSNAAAVALYAASRRSENAR
jgi:23S rRNA (guanosine2251-2'-O)-methyltransferase